MNILKISISILSILFYNNVVFGQNNINIFKSSMSDCNLKWLKEKKMDGDFEVVLDSLLSHKEIIRFKIIKDNTVLKNHKNINNYIKNVYYKDEEILSGDYFVKTDKSNLILYPFVIKNGENAPKRDRHTVKNICGSYYLISYFSMFGMGEETFNKYECMNSIIEKIKCI